MPNELKNALKASTNHTMSRQLPVAGSSTVSVMVWTISGIVLASCGGGGGGGAGGSGLSVAGGSGSTVPPPSTDSGDGGGGGSSASGPRDDIARVVDGPVKGAAVYFDIDGDGRVSDSEREAQKQNGDPMYITDANGYVNAPIKYEGHFFIANVDNATDTATGDTLSGEYQSLSTGGIATPITDLITDQIGASGSDADAQGVLDDIFGTDGLVTVADIQDAGKYKIQEYDVPKPTLPSDPTDAQRAQYDRDITKYKTSIIMKSSLALSEIDKDEAFTNLDSSTARVDALSQIFDDDPNNGDSALMARIDARVDAGREILGISKPLAQPDSRISPINEDSVFRFPQNSEDIFGFDDPNGNSDDAAASRFTGIYVKSSVDFPQADDDAHTVNLLYDGSPLSRHEGAGSDSLPDNLPPEAGFYYVSSENLSRLSIRPSDDDSGTLEVEYYVFDGEQWSDKASLEITVSPVDDPATDVAVGTRFLTAIDENTVTTGMKVADLRVDDADGPPHRLEVRGDNTGFFEIRNEDELWLVVNTGETLDYETTRTLTVQIGVAGGPDITPVNITVAVNNVNDNAPEINLEGGQNQVQNPLDEGVFPNTPTDTGYRYTASDADGGTSGLTLSGDPRERFQIDTNGNLQIKANSEFDYENPDDSSITLTITAADSGVGSGNQLINTTETVTIRLRNINDNPPVITQSGRQVPLDEGTFSSDTNTGYSYTVSDADTPRALLIPRVSGDLQNRFAIDASGNLQIKAGSEFNYESLDEGAITLTITATDSGVGPGSPAVTDTETVIITFGDVNEAPTATPRAGISTNDHTAYALEAVDFGFRDVDADDLDDQFHSVIITSLSAQGQGTLELNGNPVSINTPITFTDITNGQLIYMPNAVQEGGQPYNAQIGYRVLDDGDAGGVNKLSSATETLVIAVEQNQSATGVAVETQHLTAIDENTVTTGMKVADLRVDDADGPPHRLEVRGDNTGFFEIRNEDELWLVVNTGETLDYETTRTLTVQIGVAGGPDITPVNITVAVNNVNDNAPEINLEGGQNQVQNPLDEGVFPNTPTDTGYRYTASDADGGTSGLTLSGDPRERFQIDTNGNLQIKANSEFDYENPDDSSITLTITAADSGVGSGNQLINTTETVTIRLRNINDNPPVITQSGRQVPLDEGTFSSDTNTGYSYTVSDADTPRALLIPRVSGDLQNRFAIDASGNLQIKAGSEFNYESLDEGAITLTITATDSGVGPGSPAVTDTETVIITFGDVNEAPTATPRAGISTNDHTAYALEAVDFGFRDVDADDLDDQFHSVIITSLSAQGQGTLELNGNPVSINTPITFTDITNGQLIYMPNAVQEGGQPYNAQIGYRVLDDGDAGGVNKLSSATETLVIAVEQNQSATGVAVETQHLTAIDENTVTTGMKVADLRVDDADGPPHRLEVRGDNTGFFEIRNEDELWLVVNTGETLDYETTRTLTVQIGVAGGPDITPVNITVAVNNVNDNAPEINLEGGQNQVQNPLDEGVFPNTPTDTGYRYTASDADGGTSTLRVCVSGDAQDRFEIDADGNLQIKAGAEFDYETPADRTITLTITATDSGVGSGNPPAAATQEVTITFEDIITEINIDSGDANFDIDIDIDIDIGNTWLAHVVLVATEATPDPDIDNAVYSYQWYHIGADMGGANIDIVGATDRSYTIADTDVGKKIGVRVSYAEDSFLSDGITPTGTESITAELIPRVFQTRYIGVEFTSMDEGHRLQSERASITETFDHLILTRYRNAVIDSSDPFTILRDGNVVAKIFGADRVHSMLVQSTNGVYLVARTGFNYDNPVDADRDNNYEFTVREYQSNGRDIWVTTYYTLTIIDAPSNFVDVAFIHTTVAGINTAHASITETVHRLKFTSLEDAVRAYSGIDDVLLDRSATFGGAIVDATNHQRALVMFKVAGQADIVFIYKLSGDGLNGVRLVQDGYDVSLVTVADHLDYDNPADQDGMNTYSVVETITTTSPGVPSAHRAVSRTYTLSITDNPSDYNVKIYENHPLYRPIEIDSVDLHGYQLTEGYVDNALFTIDEDGQVWWKAVSDYEVPRDSDNDNIYEIQLSRTDINGQTDRVQVDIMVKNIGIYPAPREGYSPTFRLLPADIADEHLPSEFAQHLMLGKAWKVPVTGPVMVQYSFDTDELASFYNNNQVHINKFYSLLDAALLSFEQVANLKFIEVAHDEYDDDTPYFQLYFTYDSTSKALSTGGIARIGYSLNNIGPDRLDVVFDGPLGTIIHELGHALGLHHPFEKSRHHIAELSWPGNEDYLRSPLSVMSYSRDVTTIQPVDIEALQFLYGAPGSNFMGVESIIAKSQFAYRLAVETQTLTEIDANMDLSAGIKVADIAVDDGDDGAFGTLEIAGNHAEFFEIRNGNREDGPTLYRELWLTLEEGESLENIAALEVYVRLVEKNGTRTDDITITVSGAGSSELASGASGDATKIKIDEMVDEGQSVIANLVDLELGEIDLTEITIGGDDKDQVQIRQTQNGGVLEFVSAPDFEAPEDDDEDNVYEITLYDDLMSIEVDVTVIDVPEL